MAEVRVVYACEGEQGPTVLNLDTLIENFIEAGAASGEHPQVDVDDMAGAIDMWGGYQGQHQHGRFVVARLPPPKDKPTVVVTVEGGLIADVLFNGVPVKVEVRDYDVDTYDVDDDSLVTDADGKQYAKSTWEEETA